LAALNPNSRLSYAATPSANLLASFSFAPLSIHPEQKYFIMATVEQQPDEVATKVLRRAQVSKVCPTPHILLQAAEHRAYSIRFGSR
jgi:hypothetical protein